MPNHSETMTDKADSFSPPWAYSVWADDHNFYVEMPMTKGGTYIIRLPLNEGALAKMLGSTYHAMAKYHTLPRIMNGLAPRTENGTPEQRERARAILKRMGVI